MLSPWLYNKPMITTLQAWGNSQGVRLPKSLLAALQLETGSRVELELSPENDAIIVKAASRVRGRHRIEDLAAAMPNDYKTTELDQGSTGLEIW